MRMMFSVLKFLPSSLWVIDYDQFCADRHIYMILIDRFCHPASSVSSYLISFSILSSILDDRMPQEHDFQCSVFGLAKIAIMKRG